MSQEYPPRRDPRMDGAPIPSTAAQDADFTDVFTFAIRLTKATAPRPCTPTERAAIESEHAHFRWYYRNEP